MKNPLPPIEWDSTYNRTDIVQKAVETIINHQTGDPEQGFGSGKHLNGCIKLQPLSPDFFPHGKRHPLMVVIYLMETSRAMKVFLYMIIISY